MGLGAPKGERGNTEPGSTDSVVDLFFEVGTSDPEGTGFSDD